ncbi:1-aminocyclopropane-1-carboxylate oxidase homolog 1 [Linum perenne]
MAELKAFDATKAGVKGLVDSGVKEVPRMFHAPPHYVEPGLPFSPTDPDYILPTIDLAAVHDPVKRKQIVEEIRDASESWGFFQIVNHGVPEKIQEEMMARSHDFFEQDVEEKKKFMGTDLTKKVVYSSNFDLYTSELPECFRESVPKYTAEMIKLGELLFQLLSEALGLDKNHLKEIDYQIGGLQVLRRGSWIDVPFVPGAMVVNIGDLLQVIIYYLHMNLFNREL